MKIYFKDCKFHGQSQVIGTFRSVFLYLVKSCIIGDHMTLTVWRCWSIWFCQSAHTSHDDWENTWNTSIDFQYYAPERVPCSIHFLYSLGKIWIALCVFSQVTKELKGKCKWSVSLCRKILLTSSNITVRIPFIFMYPGLHPNTCPLQVCHWYMGLTLSVLLKARVYCLQTNCGLHFKISTYLQSIQFWSRMCIYKLYHIYVSIQICLHNSNQDNKTKNNLF